MIRALIEKDLRNAKNAFLPALLLGIPLLLVIEFTQGPQSTEKITWRSAFWVIYFFSLTALFCRSFGYENRYRNFHIYRSYLIPPLAVFFSQALVQLLCAAVLGMIYALLVEVFWTPTDLDGVQLAMIIFSVSAILAPMGTVLGLMLQSERDFIFSLIFLPLSTPVVLGAYSIQTLDDSPWPWILGTFFVGSVFLSALLFHFFFDDLTS